MSVRSDSWVKVALMFRYGPTTAGMEIEIVSDQTEKKIPLKDGYFEVTIPQQFIRNAGKTFEIEWIDFYR